MARISIALMTHNEHRELGWLMAQLARHRDGFDEIVVVDDRSDPAFQALLERLRETLPITVYRRALDRNFAAQRSFLFARCRGEVIFWLDPDELPARLLLESLRGLADRLCRERLDAVSVPRANLVRDAAHEAPPADLAAAMTSETVVWERQPRIVRRRDGIRWTGRVHERLLGLERGLALPAGPDYALLHAKTRARQEAQNRFYRSIRLRHLDKLAKSLTKRLGRARPVAWRALEEAELERLREAGRPGRAPQAR